MQEIIIKNLKHTKKIAKKISKKINGGDVILLIGDLGVGKTTFTKFFCEELGVKDVVSSPTFTILKEYQGKHNIIYHFDMYRIEDESECEEIGFFDYVNNPKNNSITLIEWPEKVSSYLTGNYKSIKIEYLENNKRKMTTNFEF